MFLINHNIGHLNVNVLLYSDVSMAVCGEISCKQKNMIIFSCNQFVCVCLCLFVCLLVCLFVCLLVCLFRWTLLIYSSFHLRQEREQAIREFLNEPARKISRYVKPAFSNFLIVSGVSELVHV